MAHEGTRKPTKAVLVTEQEARLAVAALADEPDAAELVEKLRRAWALSR